MHEFMYANLLKRAYEFANDNALRKAGTHAYMHNKNMHTLVRTKHHRYKQSFMYPYKQTIQGVGGGRDALVR